MVEQQISAGKIREKKNKLNGREITVGSIYPEMRRKKERSKQGQTRQSNTAHPRQSLFLEKMSCLGWDSNPRHSILHVHVHVHEQLHVL